LISPASGTAGELLSISLSWHAAGNATSYDVYFGASNPPPFWGNTAARSCAPSGLAGGTTYYWQVVARNGAGLTASATWSVSTRPAYAVSIFAGNGNPFYSGDNVPATSTSVYPAGIAVDPTGNLYIADGINNRIRKVSNGVITTVAGNGGYGFSGDDGPAVNATIVHPAGIAFDPAGNLYIADTGNCRVREVSNGIITTVAGNGSCDYGGDGGPAMSAGLDPGAISVDGAGNLYIVSVGSCMIWKVSNGIITTVTDNTCGSSGDGGPATSASVNPSNVAADAAGNLYVSDAYNGRVREISNGIITTVAGDGVDGDTGDNVPATDAMLDVSTGLALDAAANLYIADTYNDCVRRVSIGIISTVVVNGPAYTSDGCSTAVSGTLERPILLAVDGASNLYVVFSNDNLHVYRLSISAAPPVSAISSGGVVNSASFTAAVAPGGLASVWGSYLLNSPSQATGVPLPTTLAGVSIQIGDTLAPLLYASATLVNLQIPWEVSGQSQITLSAVLNGQNGPIQTANLVPFAPAIFATNGQGTGQGAILNGSYQLVNSSNPVSAGSTVQIYCTGLGPVTNSPSTGFPASSTTLSNTVNVPAVVIGGANAAVEFSGLTPGEVGLYQVNVIVPDGAAKGNAVPVSISIGGAMSNTVTVAIE